MAVSPKCLAAAALVVLLPADVARAQCATTTFVRIDIPGLTTFYYDDRSELPPIPGVIVGPEGTWVYEEANDEPDLQRGGGCDFGWCPLELFGPDICVESANPDRLWL